MSLAISPWQSVEATAYCQSGLTASGSMTYVGEVAANAWRMGTVLQVYPPVFGLTRFRVEDRIGWGSSIDFYTPSCWQATQFGRRIERVRVTK